MKKCSGCLRVLPNSDFYTINGKRGPRLAYQCKTCSKARVKEWKLKNPDKIAIHTKNQHKVIQLRNKPRKDARRKQILERTEKKCSVCKEVLPIDAFCAESRKLDGKDCTCRTCRNSRQKLYLDSYAKTLLSSRSSRIRHLIPQSLVDVKIAHILLKRAIKEMT